MSKITRGKRVRYTNPKTGSTFLGKVKESVETLRGLWYVVAGDDGTTVKARAASLKLV